MTSQLNIVPIQKLQNTLLGSLRKLKNCYIIYVSLNKTQKSIQVILNKAKISTEKYFFIDCLTGERSKDDVIHVAPNRLDLLATAVDELVKELPGEKYIIVDSVGTLLIYNKEFSVAKFVKKITSLASNGDVNVKAFSPVTREERFLKEVYYFFDKVKGK